jgi:hypothetical protein
MCPVNNSLQGATSLAQSVYDEVVGLIQAPQEMLGGKLNIWEFVTRPDWLDVYPKPFQEVVLKYYYKLWKDVPFSDEAWRVIEVLDKNWGIVLDLSDQGLNRKIQVLILCVGRRGTKSRLISWINAYSIYELIHLGNPQKHYGVVQEQPIEVWHTAASGRQASDVFFYTRNNVLKAPFFKPYLDLSKHSETELRFFTPHDLVINSQRALENRHLRAGQHKQPSMPGTLLVRSIPTNALTQRGKSIRTLVFSELAQYERGREELTVEELIENPQTDTAMWRALVPSTKDYGEDAQIIVESTPREKGGVFYKCYGQGGGIEVDEATGFPVDPGYQTIQLATWEANPSITRDSLEAEFTVDPLNAEREFGAHFQNPISIYLPPELLAGVFDLSRVSNMQGAGHDYVIIVDPAKNSDTYAIGWGYREGDTLREESLRYIIDGLYGFFPTVVDGFKIPINPIHVIEWLVKVLYPSLGGDRGHVREICYDQWNSQDAIHRMQMLRMPAFETTFTNPYKEKIYTEFFARAAKRQVVCYTQEISPEHNFVNRLRQELSCLQVITQGRYKFFAAPKSGSITTDDFADVVANLVYRLVNLDYPTRDSRREDARRGSPPRVIHTGLTARIGGPLWPRSRR